MERRRREHLDRRNTERLQRHSARGGARPRADRGRREVVLLRAWLPPRRDPPARGPCLPREGRKDPGHPLPALRLRRQPAGAAPRPHAAHRAPGGIEGLARRAALPLQVRRSRGARGALAQGAAAPVHPARRRARGRLRPELGARGGPAPRRGPLPAERPRLADRLRVGLPADLAAVRLRRLRRVLRARARLRPRVRPRHPRRVRGRHGGAHGRSEARPARGAAPERRRRGHRPHRRAPGGGRRRGARAWHRGAPPARLELLGPRGAGEAPLRLLDHQLLRLLHGHHLQGLRGGHRGLPRLGRPLRRRPRPPRLRGGGGLRLRDEPREAAGGARRAGRVGRRHAGRARRRASPAHRDPQGVALPGHGRPARAGGPARRGPARPGPQAHRARGGRRLRDREGAGRPRLRGLRRRRLRHLRQGLAHRGGHRPAAARGPRVRRLPLRRRGAGGHEGQGGARLRLARHHPRRHQVPADHPGVLRPHRPAGGHRAAARQHRARPDRGHDRPDRGHHGHGHDAARERPRGRRRRARVHGPLLRGPGGVPLRRAHPRARRAPRRGRLRQGTTRKARGCR